MTIFITFFALTVVLTTAKYIYSRHQKQALAKFATAHNWTELGRDKAVLNELVPNALKGLGRHRVIGTAYNLSEDVGTFLLYSYDLDFQGSGLGGSSTGFNHQITRSFTVLTLTLNTGMPSLYLRRHSMLDGTAQYDSENKLTLEGDFNKHFEVYSPKGNEVEALSLLTPDTMAFIEDQGTGFDIELNGKKLTLIADGSFTSSVTLNRMLDFAQKMAHELNAKPFATKQSATLQTVAGKPQLRHASLFSKNVRLIVIMAIIAMLLFFLFSFFRSAARIHHDLTIPSQTSYN